MNKVYTLGYTSTTPEELQKMAEERDALVFDIRLNPRSRAQRWNVPELREAMQGRYRYLYHFGNENYKNGGPIQLHNPETGVAVIRSILKENSVILLCACYDHRYCHRTVAADLLKERLGVEVEHLYGSRKGR